MNSFVRFLPLTFYNFRIVSVFSITDIGRKDCPEGGGSGALGVCTTDPWAVRAAAREGAFLSATATDTQTYA